MITFLNNKGCRCLTITNVVIDIDTNVNNYRHLISPYDLNGIDFMFSEMLYLTTMPTIHEPSTICLKIPSFILLNANNKEWGFEQPPQGLDHFHLDAGIARATLIRAQQPLLPGQPWESTTTSSMAISAISNIALSSSSTGSTATYYS
jgi:hypothetical protein